MRESKRLEDRQVTDALENPAAKIKASRLWGSDIGQYAVFVQEQKIITGKLVDIRYYGDDVTYRSTDIRKGSVRLSLVMDGSGDQHNSYVLTPNEEVWILRDKPEVTVMGVQVADKRIRR